MGAELLATGAQIVAYIPETLTDLWDTSQLSQMQASRANASHPVEGVLPG